MGILSCLRPGIVVLNNGLKDTAMKVCPQTNSPLGEVVKLEKYSNSVFIAGDLEDWQIVAMGLT